MKKKYRKICLKYIKKFEKKQDVTFLSATLHTTSGSYASINFENNLKERCTFEISDIIFDIDSKQRPGLILDWYHQMDFTAYNDMMPFMYKSYAGEPPIFINYY